ncbi:hypothetical protein JA33_318 [Dickeya phage vB_DsoM_JA33]|uniref:HNH endonuclease n=2 Tax=Salmondvirus JA11 TaxID=2734141 RepID=A0A386K7Y8_9CAUD|nr:hypothetical protein HOU32_gp318 [Dickeya phage vB_DsoM_JA11]AXG67692.1 hypothetical protein JA33_318 [Dickeya phage vB_DsoM_JA33]AYD80123.1 hypothetical protein JA11_318 [Dickeya phage vB_DsoM_JA11]
MAAENRLYANERNGLTQCCICGTFTKAIHWHHTIPQSLGGKDSLQIPLDGNCHTALHAKASAVVSKMHGKRKTPVGEFWDDPKAEQAAEVWLKILVDAMLVPPVDPSSKMILLPSIQVDVETRLALELLKRDTPGITSMSQVLRFCIEATLKIKGLRNDEQQEFSHSRSERNGKKHRDLW